MLRAGGPQRTRERESSGRIPAKWPARGRSDDRRRLVDLHADFLVIGSGIAALRAAIALCDAGDVLILTKGERDDGSTGFAQGGIAAAMGEDDSPSRHAEDTMAAGDGLCDPGAVSVMVEAGPSAVRELLEWGADFDRTTNGRLSLAREGAHSVARVVHARDATGREITRALWARASSCPNIRLVSRAEAVAVHGRNGRCAGVLFVDGDGARRIVTAGVTLLATGGTGQVYRETTNPLVATGDGIALGYRAGARVCDLEFIQFHPTVLDCEGTTRFLLSEALRGEGARLVSAHGERFMSRYEPQGELAARDRVARAIAIERERTHQPVYLTLDHLPADYVHGRFPAVSAACRRAGLDLARDRIPVGPAAHYVMGGLETDLDGRTSVPGLFAAGEVACTRVHGANRLASNSLLEGLVFGARAAGAMRDWVHRRGDTWPAQSAPPPPPEGAHDVAPGAPLGEAELRDLMWNAVGLFREGTGLARTVARLDAAWYAECASASSEVWLDPRRRRAANLVSVGRLIARAALRREESRGAHFRSDFSRRDDIHWTCHVADAIAPLDL